MWYRQWLGDLKNKQSTHTAALLAHRDGPVQYGTRLGDLKNKQSTHTLCRAGGFFPYSSSCTFRMSSANMSIRKERPQSTCSKIMFSLFFLIWSEWIPAFFKSLRQEFAWNQTEQGEIDVFRTISKVLVYVFCSKRIDFRAILRNTLGTLVDSGLSPRARLRDRSGGFLWVSFCIGSTDRIP